MAKGIERLVSGIKRNAIYICTAALLSGSAFAANGSLWERDERQSEKVEVSEPIAHMHEVSFEPAAVDGPRSTIPDERNRAFEYEIVGDNENIEKLLDSIDTSIKEGKPAKNCWYWIDNVYTDAGVPRDSRAVIYNKHRSFGKRHMNRRQLKTLETGDWIYVHNRNGRDKYGNHSVIFIDWVNEKRRVALIAESPGKGHAGRYSKMSLWRNPVVFASKPR